MRQILSKDEAIKVLKPFFETIANSVKSGFMDYQDMMSHDAETKHRILKIGSATQSSLINGLIIERIKENFKDVKGATPKHYNYGLFALHIKSQVLLRFKKFNSNFAPVVSKSNQALKISKQHTVIAGFPRKATFLYIGYTYNKDLTGLKVFVSLRVKGERKWIYDFTHHITQEAKVVPFTSVTTTTERTVKPRLRVTKNMKANGTNQ